MRKRFSLCKKVGVFLLTAVMCTSQLNVQAEKKYDFETEYQVVAGANGYFIAKNQKGEYGLLDREGEKAVVYFSSRESPPDSPFPPSSDMPAQAFHLPSPDISHRFPALRKAHPAQAPPESPPPERWFQPEPLY